MIIAALITPPHVSAITGSTSVDFARTSAITLPGEDFLESAVIDATKGFAYFGTDTFPGNVVKVDLTTFSRVAAITFEFGEGGLSSAVIDDAKGFAYFGSDATPGNVVKVDLATFTRVGAIVLPGGEDRLRCAVIDATKGFAYFGTAAGRVVKVDLTTFTRVGAIDLVFGGVGLSSAVIDAAKGFAYFGSDTTPGNVVKVDLATFTRVGAITFEFGEGGLSSAVIDDAKGFAYFGTFAQIGIGGSSRVVRVDLATFTRVGAIISGPGATGLRSAVIDAANGFAYFATPSGQVVKVNLLTFTRVGAVTLAGVLLTSAVIDVRSGFAYFGTDMSPGQIFKVDLASFAQAGAITLPGGEDRLISAVIDTANGFAYVGTSTAPGRVVKVDLATFTRVATIALAAEDLVLRSAVIDSAGGFAYFGTNTIPGRVVKVDLATFTRVEAITLAPGEDRLSSAVVDTAAGFAYFGTNTIPGRVVKVDLATFTRVEAITFAAGEDLLTSAIIDTAKGFAYFGTETGRVVKVDLASFTRVGAIDLAFGLSSAVIDTAKGFAYFGADGRTPGSVVRIDLVTFSSTGSITFKIEGGFSSAVIDTPRGFAYFGTTDTFPGNVVKVDLATFAQAGAITFAVGEHLLTAGIIDAEKGFAYFGTYTEPGRVVKVSLSVGAPDTTPPIITVPGSIFASATGPEGAVVTYIVTATDDVDGSITPSCNPSSGSTFPLGTTTVTCTATDRSGNQAASSFLVRVVDLTQPAITSATITPTLVGPAGQITITKVVTDNVGVASVTASVLTKWGSLGTGDGQFNAPFGLAVDPSGNVYVADTLNDRIQKFDPAGTFLTTWGTRCDLSTLSGCNTLAPGASVAGDGQFNSPIGLAVDRSGNVYVADAVNHRIQKFDPTGVFMTKWSSFVAPIGVAVDPSGNVYVSDPSRIQKFGPTGMFITKWGSFCHLSDGSGCVDPDGAGPLALGDGQFVFPRGVAVDPSGNVYVADPSNGRIQKFGPTGMFITKWGSFCRLSDGSGCVDPDGAGPLALGDGQFFDPEGVAVDRFGDVYVSDSINNRIQKFDSDGAFIAKWGSQGAGDGQFFSPDGVAVDSDSNVYVADALNHRIQKFIALNLPLTLMSGTPQAGTWTRTFTFLSAIPDGTYTVVDAAADAAGNLARFSDGTVMLDRTPPEISIPTDIKQEATGPSGSIVSFVVTAQDVVDGPVAAMCTPTSGSTFPLGTTMVTCTASDFAGNPALATFRVIIRDTTLPALVLPVNFIVEATGPLGGTATYTASALDVVDGILPVTCSPPSGSTLPFGPTTVQCSAMDSSGNTATGSFTVTVLDTRPPLILLDGSSGKSFTMRVEATGPEGAYVRYPITVVDAVDPNPTLDCRPPSGSLFSLPSPKPGEPSKRAPDVHCTATDSAGNQATIEIFVEIVDTTPPILTVPLDITAEATGPGGAAVSYVATSADIVDGSVAPICTPASGATFPLGPSVVSCVATDVRGNSVSRTFTVTVRDTTPPALSVPSNIVTSTIDPSGIAVTFAALASDLVDVTVTPTCSPASGAVFPVGTTTITCTATDSHGNGAVGTFTVTVVLFTGPTGSTTTVTTDPSGNTVITSKDSSGTTVTEVILPPGTTFASGASVTFTSKKASGMTQVTGITVPYPPGKTIRTLSKQGAKKACVVDGPTGASLNTVKCKEDLSQSTVLLQCSDAGISRTVTFPAGLPPVSRTYTCTSSSNGQTGYLTVSGLAYSALIADGTPPDITVPVLLTVEAIGPGTPVFFTATASDDLGTASDPICSPLSGSAFTAGTTTVTCQSTDWADNVGTATFTVTVTPRPTSTTVACIPSAVLVYQRAVCVAIVKDRGVSAPATPPRGTVGWSSGPSGSFFHDASCTLVAVDGRTSFCWVIFTPIVGGLHTITATYPGRSPHAESSGTDGLRVKAPTTLSEPTLISGPTRIVSGQTGTWTFSYRLTANSPLTHVKVQGGLNPNLAIAKICVDSSCSGTIRNSGTLRLAGTTVNVEFGSLEKVVTWFIASMKPGESRSITTTLTGSFGSAGSVYLTGPWSGVVDFQFGTFRTTSLSRLAVEVT